MSVNLIIHVTKSTVISNSLNTGYFLKESESGDEQEDETPEVDEVEEPAGKEEAKVAPTVVAATGKSTPTFASEFTLLRAQIILSKN